MLALHSCGILSVTSPLCGQSQMWPVWQPTTILAMSTIFLYNLQNYIAAASQYYWPQTGSTPNLVVASSTLLKLIIY